MIRFLVRTFIFLASAAVGLLVAAVLLDEVTVGVSGFLLTVVIYAVVQSVISPFLVKFAMVNAKALLGGIGLVATLVALIIADFYGDALAIRGGLRAWILATLIVWLTTVAATFLLPLILIKLGIKAAWARRQADRSA